MILETVWFNPKSGEIRQVSDHGEAVMEDPAAFGIDDDIIRSMIEAYGDEEIDSTVEENAAWEQLAIDTGWVRCGEARQNHHYICARTADLAWHGVSLLAEHGLLEAIDVELSNADDLFKLFVRLEKEAVEEFLSAGPRRAEAFLERHRRTLGSVMDAPSPIGIGGP
jgi:hypothetical protein